MRAGARYLVAALVLAAAAAMILMGGLVQRQLAEGQRELATLNLTRAARHFSDVQNRLWFAEAAPWLLTGTKHELAARQAEVRYWRGEHAALVTEYPDLSRPDVRANRALQLTLARAHVRAGEGAAAGSRTVRLNELDRAISVHAQVLRNTGGDPDAAYNYEFLVRLRQDLAAGAAAPARRPDTPLGRPGDVDEEMDMDDLNEMKIYVPSDMLERESAEDPTLGTDAPLRRRG